MFESFTPGARTAVVHAQQHARRLGHRYIGTEHLLLALAGTDQPASAVLHEHGITPEFVEEEIVRRAGLGTGTGAGLLGDLDQGALSAIGIDLDAVRASIEASFGTAALARASQAVHSRPRRSRRSRLDPRRAIPPRLRRRRHRHRPGAPMSAVSLAAPAASPRPAATGRYHAAGSLATGHIPFTPGAKQSIQSAVLEAQLRRDAHVGVEHLAFGLITTNRGLVPPILSAAGASGPSLRAAILDRYRRAS